MFPSTALLESGYRGAVAPTMTLSDALSDVLRERIQREGRNVTKLAAAAGISPAQLRRYLKLRSDWSPITVDAAEKVGAELHLTMDELIQLANARRR